MILKQPATLICLIRFWSMTMRLCFGWMRIYGIVCTLSLQGLIPSACIRIRKWSFTCHLLLRRCTANAILYGTGAKRKNVVGNFAIPCEKSHWVEMKRCKNFFCIVEKVEKQPLFTLLLQIQRIQIFPIRLHNCNIRLFPICYTKINVRL